MSIYATSYPLVTGRPVTQGHADYCAEHGHATHKVNGVDQGICPRCMEVTEPTPAPAPRTPRYVQVNIGRNIPAVMPDGSPDPQGEQRPMPDERWGAFIGQVAVAIADATAFGGLQDVQVHTGKGEWNGVEEESAHLSTFADVDLFKLRTELARLKREYQQDAIALIAGSDLI